MNLKEKLAKSKSLAQNGIAKATEFGRSAIAASKPFVVKAATSVNHSASDAATVLNGFVQRLERSDKGTIYGQKPQ